jgi:hypothetical protein
VRRLITCSLVAIALIVALTSHTLSWWAAVVAAVVVGPLAWRFSECSHSGQLALLPATTDLEGRPLPPRWHCDRCGKTWTANFEKEQSPVQRFTGYDESKAVNAAKRAAELEERQRLIALRRAGLEPTTKKAKASRTARAREAADVIQIRGRRRVS